MLDELLLDWFIIEKSLPNWMEKNKATKNNLDTSSFKLDHSKMFD